MFYDFKLYILLTDGPFTLFAPTNDAFKTLPTDALARLNGSPTEMKKVLMGHVAKGTFFLSALDGTDTSMPTLDGKNKKVLINGRRKLQYSNIKSILIQRA